MCVSHGHLNDEQEAVLRTFVAGYCVHDLGAGQLGLAKKLVELGAHMVTALDKEYSWNFHRYQANLPHVLLVGETFEEYARHGHFVDVAFISWPVAHHLPGLVDIIRQARTVIYLGSNFDGTVCGSHDLFEHLLQREVLALVPHRFHRLIVYGMQGVQRAPLPEEYAALHRGRGGFAYEGGLGAELR